MMTANLAKDAKIASLEEWKTSIESWKISVDGDMQHIQKTIAAITPPPSAPPASEG